MLNYQGLCIKCSRIIKSPIFCECCNESWVLEAAKIINGNSQYTLQDYSLLFSLNSRTTLPSTKLERLQDWVDQLVETSKGDNIGLGDLYHWLTLYNQLNDSRLDVPKYLLNIAQLLCEAQNQLKLTPDEVSGLVKYLADIWNVSQLHSFGLMLNRHIREAHPNIIIQAIIDQKD